MSFVVLRLLLLMIVLPVAAFIVYQNKHNKRSIWDEAATPAQGAKKTKD